MDVQFYPSPPRVGRAILASVLWVAVTLPVSASAVNLQMSTAISPSKASSSSQSANSSKAAAQRVETAEPARLRVTTDFQANTYLPWVALKRGARESAVVRRFVEQPAAQGDQGLVDQATGLLDRVLARTQTAIASLPAVPVSLHLSEEGAGFSLPLSQNSELTIGNMLNDAQSRSGVVSRTGVNLVTRISDHARFFIGLEKRSGDAQETLSGLGMLYDLD